MDSLPDQALDDLAELAARICEVPIGRISLVDDDRECFTPTFAQHDLFIVDDACADQRFVGGPLVIAEPGIRFYAGAPLVTPAGTVLGALCVLDRVPRMLSEFQQDALRVLSRQVMAQLELRRQTLELAGRERFLQAIFDSEPECVKVLGRDGSVLMMNRAGLRMIEADSFAQIAGGCVSPLIVPEDRAPFEELTDRVFRGESGVLEFRITGLKGRELWMESNATPLREDDGTVTALLAIARDITVHKQAEAEKAQLEEQLRQAQKLEAVGQLAGGVAHDFNNILMAIMMQAEMAAMSSDLPAETREYLDDIKGQAQRAANLTRQLLTFSRRQVMQSRTLDVNDVVTNLSVMLQRILGADVRLNLNLLPHPLMIRADPGMIDQVFMNLVVNARDAMPNGGHLIIETGTRDLSGPDHGAASAVPRGHYAVVRVTDSGTGISEDNLRRIFEPFFTTKDPGKGTGLGLATVFGIVKQHGGSIQVHSEIGRGTTFEILLPVEEASARTVMSEKSNVPPRGGTETILVVEDEPNVRALNRAVLERNGYTVLEASHGVEALKVWEEHPGTIHMLLTDIVMPEGISGRALAARLQKSSPGLKVIFTSGYSAEIAGADFDLQVGQNYLQKPSTLQQLLDTVRQCLDGNGADCLDPSPAAPTAPAGSPLASQPLVPTH